MLKEKEKMIMDFMEEENDFIIPLQIEEVLGLNFENGNDITEIFNLLNGLVEKGLIRRRDCMGIAFELVS